MDAFPTKRTGFMARLIALRNPATAAVHTAHSPSRLWSPPAQPGHGIRLRHIETRNRHRACRWPVDGHSVCRRLEWNRVPSRFEPQFVVATRPPDFYPPTSRDDELSPQDTGPDGTRLGTTCDPEPDRARRRAKSHGSAAQTACLRRPIGRTRPRQRGVAFPEVDVSRIFVERPASISAATHRP